MSLNFKEEKYGRFLPGVPNELILGCEETFSGVHVDEVRWV